MDRPRAHSVMQVRPTQSPFGLRASKLFHKVSSKFTRSPPDPGGPNPSTYEGPYMRNTYSMDGAAKPYMSQPILGLMLAPVEDSADSDGSDSPLRSESQHVPLPPIRPPPPSRAPPPPPNTKQSAPTLSLHTNPPSVNLPIVTPPTPISPSTRLGPAVELNAEQFPTRRDSLPPLRRARSQTLVDGRNWSRPSSTLFGASAQAALGMAGSESSPSNDDAVSSTPSGSTISSTSSYATARGSVISTASTISSPPGQSALSGLPVLDRHETVTTGLPFSTVPSPSRSMDGLPPGAARAVDPHQYSPVQETSFGTITPPLTPSILPTGGSKTSKIGSSSSTAYESRRASVASFASVTSIDSFATARSGGWPEDDDDDEGGMTPTVGDEEAQDVAMPLAVSLSREGTVRSGEARERAETLRGVPPPSVTLNSPASSRIVAPESPSTPTVGRSPLPATSPASSNTPTPTNSIMVASSSPAPTVTPSSSSQPAPPTPPSPKGPFSPRSPMRAASLPPISTIPLVIPTAPLPTLEPRSSVLLRASPSSSSPSVSPWGSNGFAPSSISPRTRTASAGYSPSPTSTRSMTGTLPARRPPSIPMSLHRYSMTFNPGVPLSPGGGDLGRLSPSIIVRQPPLAIPVHKLPSVSSPVVERSPVNSETVGRRSSVIFSPHGVHERETSKAVVRSMPALAMEGPSEVEPAAGESDSENEDDIGEDDADDGDDDDDDSRRPSVDVRDETESPFVPLRLDTTSSLSLEFGGLLSGVGLGLGSPVISKGKGKERESVQIPFAIQPQASQSSSKTILPGKTPMPQSPQPRNSDYFSIRSPSADGRTPIPGPASPLVRTIPMPPLPSPGGERPGMYKHASRSMVDIFASVTSPEEDTLSTKGKGKEDERGEAPAYEGHGVQRNSTLKRRRSMPEVSAAPPPYTSPMFPSPFFEAGTANLHPLAQVRIVPREDEGRETLPPYSNSILLRSIMPRKMEFSAPGVQAKDRKWRRVLCELEGTVFRVYRCAAEGWWERRVGVGDVTAAGVGSAAVAAAAAIKARAAAREGAEDIKLAGEQGRLESNGEGSGGESGEGTTEITMAPGSSMSSSRSRASSSATSASHTLPSSASSITDGNSISTSASRSRLNLGLSLLKPRSHGRSKSELPNAPKTPVTPRSSLSVQRPSFGSNSSPPASAMPSTSGAALTPSRSNVSLASSSRTGLLSARTPATPSSAKGKQKGTTSADLSEPDQQDLIRAYTLQHAESGLGNDYLKRKHVLRVRLEGEQFLLQARDVGDVVDWIEALHCATNIALDLDERPMPKGPLFPRRRRRRPRATAGGPADRPDGSSTAT